MFVEIQYTHAQITRDVYVTLLVIIRATVRCTACQFNPQLTTQFTISLTTHVLSPTSFLHANGLINVSTYLKTENC